MKEAYNMGRSVWFCRFSHFGLVLLLCTAGCVSNSDFESYRSRTDHQLRSLEDDVSALRGEIEAIRGTMNSRFGGLRGSLDDSEKKLKEMEDRVIEIRTRKHVAAYQV